MGLSFRNSKEQLEKERLEREKVKQKKEENAAEAAWAEVLGDLRTAGLLFYEQSDEELKNQNLLALHKLYANKGTAHLSEKFLVGLGMSQIELRMSALLFSIMTQNWILIRQNEAITRLLERIAIA